MGSSIISGPTLEASAKGEGGGRGRRLRAFRMRGNTSLEATASLEDDRVSVHPLVACARHTLAYVPRDSVTHRGV